MKVFLPRAVLQANPDIQAYIEHGEGLNPISNALTWSQAMAAVEELQSAFRDYRVTSCQDFFPAEVFELLENCKLDIETISKSARARQELILTKGEPERDALYIQIAMQRMTMLDARAEVLARQITEWADAYLANIERLNDGHLTPSPSR